MPQQESQTRTEKSRANHHGDVLLAREVAGFRVVDNGYSPGLSLPNHFHDRSSIYFVQRGEFQEAFGTRVLELKQGSLLFRPAGQLHANQFGRRGARCLVIDLPDQWLKHVRELARFPHESLCRRDGEIVRLGMRLCQEFWLGEPPASLAVEGLLLEIAASLSQPDGHPSPDGRRPRWLQTVTDLLHGHYKDRIQLSHLAALVEIHPVHLARVFRKHHRASVGQYVQRLRVEYACTRLAEGDSSIAAIALEAGFANQAHFSRVFKLVTGTSPAKYRAGVSQC
jgi:AraC family transcriptional regulator